MAGEYLSTDPNAGAPATGGGYLSTDPNAGEPAKGAIGSQAVVDRQAGNLGRKASAQMRKVLGTQDKDVDYEGVPDSAAQAAYSIISSPTSKTQYLKDKYGAANVTKDSYGRDVVVQDGKKVAFVPQAGSKNAAASLASAAGEVAPVAGMIAGGVAGAPGGPGTGAALSAGGGAAGVALNKLVARAIGLPDDQSSEQAAKDIILQGAVPGAAGELVGRGLGLAGRTLLGPYRGAEGGQARSALGPFAGNNELWQETMRQLDAAQAYGLTPYIGSAAPGARLAQRAQSISARIFGDEIPKKNAPILQSNIESLSTGAAGGQTTQPTAAGLTSKVSGKADELISAAETDAAKARTSAENIVSQAAQRTKTLSENLEGDIRASRQAFSDDAKKLYGPVDEMAGKPIVPTAGIKEQLGQILKDNPLIKPSEVFAKSIQDLPDYVTFQQMQSIRSTLYSKGDFAALNTGLSDRHAGQLAQAANLSFDAAAKGPFAGSAKATEALHNADKFYKEGMRKFDDMNVEALVKDASKAGNIAPEKAALYVAQPGQVDRLMRIQKVVTPETFQQIGDERFRLMMEDSRNPLNGQLSGEKLQRNMAALSKTDEQGRSVFDALYGKRAGEMRGKIKDVLDKEKALDEVVKTDWLRAVKTDGPESLRAADYLTGPESQLRLRKAIETFGKDSEEARGLKEYMARKIFSSMVKEPAKGAERYVSQELSGQQLKDTLNKYGRPFLEDIYGKEWTDSTFKFADAAAFATKKNPGDGGAIVAAALAVHPLAHVALLAKIFAGGELLSSKAGIQYLSRGFMQGGFGQMVRDVSMFGTRVGSDYGAYETEQASENAGQRVKAKAQSVTQ